MLEKNNCHAGSKFFYLQSRKWDTLVMGKCQLDSWAGVVERDQVYIRSRFWYFFPLQSFLTISQVFLKALISFWGARRVLWGAVSEDTQEQASQKTSGMTYKYSIHTSGIWSTLFMSSKGKDVSILSENISPILTVLARLPSISPCMLGERD